MRDTLAQSGSHTLPRGWRPHREGWIWWGTQATQTAPHRPPNATGHDHEPEHIQRHCVQGARSSKKMSPPNTSPSRSQDNPTLPHPLSLESWTICHQEREQDLGPLWSSQTEAISLHRGCLAVCEGVLCCHHLRMPLAFGSRGQGGSRMLRRTALPTGIVQLQVPIDAMLRSPVSAWRASRIFP